jgi:hypothetical protein
MTSGLEKWPSKSRMKACGFTKRGAGAPPLAKHPFELDIGTAASLWAREERFKSIPKGFKIPGRAAVVPQFNCGGV